MTHIEDALIVPHTGALTFIGSAPRKPRKKRMFTMQANMACVQCNYPTTDKGVCATNGGAGIHRPWIFGPLCDGCREAWIACLIEEGKRIKAQMEAEAQQLISPKSRIIIP